MLIKGEGENVPIERSIDREKDLTLFTVSGTIAFDELFAAVQELHVSSQTKFTLWDILGGDLTLIGSAELRRIAEFSYRYGSKRKGGKTALLMGESLNFGVGRIYEVFAETEALPFEVRAFKDRRKAMDWLFGTEQKDE